MSSPRSNTLPVPGDVPSANRRCNLRIPSVISTAITFLPTPWVGIMSSSSDSNTRSTHQCRGRLEVDYPWNDLNGDRFVQANELDTDTVLWLWNFDPENPDSFVSPNVIDPDLSPPVTDELILGLERELIPEFSLGVNYIYRRFSNFVWEDWSGWIGGGIKSVGTLLVGVRSSDFVPVETSWDGQPIVYYELPFPRPAGEVRTNWPDYDQRYHGLEVTGWKRLSNRWMLNFGFTYSDHREYYRSDKAVYDPTNAEIRRGGQVFTPGGARMSSRWNFKLDGLVQLLAGINLAGRLNARQGFIFPQTFETRSRGGGIGRADVLLIPIGDSRYEDLWLVDLRIDKTFDLGRARITGMVDFFNIFNTATVLRRHFRQNRANANQVRDILAPRVVRFGVRCIF